MKCAIHHCEMDIDTDKHGANGETVWFCMICVNFPTAITVQMDRSDLAALAIAERPYTHVDFMGAQITSEIAKRHAQLTAVPPERVALVYSRNWQRTIPELLEDIGFLLRNGAP